MAQPSVTYVEEKLQVLAIIGLLILQAGTSILIPLTCIYLVFYSSQWWLCLIYFAWMLTVDKETPEQDGRRSEWVRNWKWWVYVKNYFPIKLTKTSSTPLNPDRNYLFCYFPHGILATSALITLATNASNFKELFPNHTPYLHTISLFFKMPFLREISLWLGGLTASGKSLEYILSKPRGGNISGLVVGGAAEANFSNPGVHKIFYKNRKGFVKLALKTGSPIVPVYCFGETDVYSQREVVEGSLFSKFQKIVHKYFGFSPITPVGEGYFGLLPHRHPINIVVGDPLDVEKIEEPTQGQIDEVHSQFEKKLVELFESQKKHYIENYEKVHLEVS